jgi:phosphoglucomutase
MILGRQFFVTPSDSLAIIAANSEHIPFFRDAGEWGKKLPWFWREDGRVWRERFGREDAWFWRESVVRLRIPGCVTGGLKTVARSMPTSQAVDRVCDSR